MIIIADAHISSRNGLGPEFFQMLAMLETTREDIVFLGDIFDLWIAYPRYENHLHHQFLDWCHKEKSRRKLYFVEGNHEFFLNHLRRAAFTDYSANADGLCINGALFIHGDTLNPKDTKYLFFRKLIKNQLIAWLVKYLPVGPKIAHGAKVGLKKTNHNFRKFVPVNDIINFAQKSKLQGVTAIFVGHFHKAKIMEQDGVTICLCPAWGETRQVTTYNNGAITFCDYRSLA